MKHSFIITFLSLLLIVIGANAQTNDKIFQEIRGMNLPGVTITEIQDISDGKFTLPGGKTFTNLPGILRVAFTSKPTQGSNIRSEIWMPKVNWNGRFLGTGNGGGAGKIIYDFLVAGVLRGYATANTDMGTSSGADEAAGHPEIWVDFGNRSTHAMTKVSKAILQMYYKKLPHHSYFTGCSTGGQQALMEAQRYPDDYNGIIAGSPANNRTHLHASFIWNLIANNKGQDKAIISQKKMVLLSKLVIKNCGGKDGGAPGDDFLTDPGMCKFDLEILPQCKDGTETDSCFSGTEIAALKKMYAGPTNPRTGERIYTPLPLGELELIEYAWHFYLFKWVFGEKFDYTKFDFDHDMEKVDSLLAPMLNANNPNLKQMKNRGGKF